MKRHIGLLLFLLCIGITWAEGTNSDYRFTVQFSPARIRWNPHYAYTTTEAQIFTALYEGLATLHPATLRPIPAAAESWETNEEGTLYRFFLRDDLKWSNGETLDAHDFRESWLTLMNPEVEAEYASLLDMIVGAQSYRTGMGDAEDVGIEVIDSQTLEVRLERASPQFLSILCHYTFAPIHKDFREMKDWSAVRSVPVNGPYTISARTPEEILFDANPEYWDQESVGVSHLRLIFLDDPEDVMARYNRFEIDWIVSGMDTSLLSTQEALNVSPLFSTTYYYFSNVSGTWTDGRVRRALALLVPWEEIRGDRFIPGTSLVPPIPNYPLAEAGFPSITERKEEAMTLLSAAGYPEGKGLPSPVLRVPTDDIVAQAMKKAWDEELGLETIIESVDFANYYRSVREGGFDIATLTWTGDYADPHTFLGMWESTSSFNDARYENPAFDALLRTAATLPRQERLDKLKEAEEILLRTCQVMPVEHFPAVNIIDTRFVDGWFPNALDIHPFKNLSPKLGFDIPGVALRSMK